MCCQISNPDATLKPRISSLRTSRLSHGSKPEIRFSSNFSTTHQLTALDKEIWTSLALELQRCTAIRGKIDRNFRQTNWNLKNRLAYERLYIFRWLCFCKYSSHILFRLIIVHNGRWWIHAYMNYGKISHLKRIFQHFLSSWKEKRPGSDQLCAYFIFDARLWVIDNY